MYCDLLLYSVYVGTVTILLTFPVEIKCCSTSLYDIISLMSQPNYQNDPCYIKWQAAEDAKLKQLYAQQDQFQRVLEYNRMEQQAREQEARQQSYASISKETTKLVTGSFVLC